MNKPILLWLALLFCVFHESYSQTEAGKNETVTTEAPKIKILDSELCKKCNCTADSKSDIKYIDCSFKLYRWFTDDEWKLLQSGDIIFDSIVLENNNLTNVPLLPTYGLKNLYLANNKINEIAKGAFRNLTEIVKLDLSNNSISSKTLVADVFQGTYSPHDFEPLGKLKSLNLGNNELHTLDDDLFEHMPSLEELILCSNVFGTIDKPTETALSTLPSIKTLDLSYMELKELPDTILHGPRDLETLIISGNLFDELPEALELAINLKRLVLDENPIKDLGGENVFPNLTKLNYLSMSYMPDMHSIGAGSFSNLQGLTELILSDNGMLTHIDENALSKNVTGMLLDYPPLKKLYLNNGNLTELHQNLLVRWDKLEVLDLRYNPWSCNLTNEWLVDILMPQIEKTTPLLSKNVECGSPEGLKGVQLVKISRAQLEDVSASGGGSLVWVGLLVTVLLIVPLALAGFALYRRGCFGFVKRNDSVADRALYNRASFNEDFHI